MRVVIVGASGFLGGALAAALANRGMELLCTARDPGAAQATAGWPQAHARWIAADMGELPGADFWARHLRSGDVVINAVGMLRERWPGEFAALHHHGPAQLFDACIRAKVALVVQISALGAAIDAASAYHRSKAHGDLHLRGCPVTSVVVQPSLVWGDSGSSAGFFAALAVLPLLILPQRGAQRIQPVHLEDFVAAVLALVERLGGQGGSRTVPLVGPQPVSLRDYLARLRAQLGHSRRACVLPLNRTLFRGVAAVAGLRRDSLLDADTAGMLLQGSLAAPDEIAALLGRPPRDYGTFISPAHAVSWRRAAWLHWMLPLLRWSIALVWIWTFAVSIGLHPRADSLQMLERVGVRGAWGGPMLDAAAGLNLALGVATLAWGAAWRARLLWPMQLALIGFYTAAITLAMPEFWLHPFGPLSKNLPMCAAILLLWAMDAGSARRRAAPMRL